MTLAYSPEVAELHRQQKSLMVNQISVPTTERGDYFRERSERLDYFLERRSAPAVLAVLEWNTRHYDLREADVRSKDDIARDLSVKMSEEVDEYEDALRSVDNQLNTQDVNTSWYKREQAPLLWKVGGEIVDAGIYAIGILEILGYNVWQLINLSSFSPDINPEKGKVVNRDDKSEFEIGAIHVLGSVSFHTNKICVPIRSLMFYKALQNEQHRTNALYPQHQLNGYSKTLRRSVGPLIWNNDRAGGEVDSQIPALAQSWVGPTVIETYVEPNEYEMLSAPLSSLIYLSDMSSFSNLYPEPVTRQKAIEVWRNT